MAEQPDFPIDILLPKFVDWMVDRKKLPRQWQTSLRKVHDLVQAAARDMPDEGDLKALLQSSSINYFQVQKIVNALKLSEGDTKNIFGQYSSKRLKEWSNILKEYEHDNLHLGEAGWQMNQTVAYEIPNMRREMSRLGTAVTEAQRKEQEAEKSSADFLKKYKAACAKLNIEGVNVEKEVGALVSNLPSLYRSVYESVGGIREPLEYFSNFFAAIAVSSSAATTPDLLLPHLKSLINNAQRLVDKSKADEEEERKRAALAESGSKTSGPGIVLEPKLDLDISWDTGMEVSGGDDSLSTLQASLASLDTTTSGGASVPAVSFDIDWSGLDDTKVELSVESSGDVYGEAMQSTGKELSIDWDDLSVAEATTGAQATAADLVVGFENDAFRTDIVNELLELKTFLLQRQQELQKDDSAGSSLSSDFWASLAASNPDSKSLPEWVTVIRRNNTSPVVASHIAAVTKILNVLDGEECKQLVMIQTSKRYRDRLVKNTTQLKASSEVQKSIAEEMRRKQEECTQQIYSQQAQLRALIRLTKETQKKVEEAMSKLLQGKVVNIMGEINALVEP